MQLFEHLGLLRVGVFTSLSRQGNNMNQPGVRFIDHAIDGQPGCWRIPEKGWYGYRQQSYSAMACANCGS